MNKIPESNFWLSSRIAIPSKLLVLNNCLCTHDFNSSGYHSLVICDCGKFVSDPNDLSSKLVFLGENSETKFFDLQLLSPSIVSLQIDPRLPLTPVLAVTQGSDIFLFKNLQPFYKFSVSNLPVSKDEVDCWSKYSNNEFDDILLLKELTTLRQSGISLSSQSLMALNLQENELLGFLKAFKSSEPTRLNTVTNLTKIFKDGYDKSSIECLVYGTEDGTLNIIDPIGFKILKTFYLDSPSHEIHCKGIFEKTFRILVLTRSGKVFSIRPENVTAQQICSIDSFTIRLIAFVQNFVIMTIDHIIKGYNKNNIEIFCNNPPKDCKITAICNIQLEQKCFEGYATALENGALSLYDINGIFLHYIRNPHNIIDNVVEIPYTLYFGKFGREEEVLVCLFKSGEINVFIPKRSFKTDRTENLSNLNSDILEDVNNHPLELSNMTKNVNELAVRAKLERKYPNEFHQNTKREILKVKLRISEELIDLLQSNNISVPHISTINQNKAFSISSVVFGFGPEFIIKTTISKLNNLTRNYESSFILCFSYDSNLYNVRKPILNLPIFFSNSNRFVTQTNIKSIDPEEKSDNVQVILMQSFTRKMYLPVAMTIVNMPETGAVGPNELFQLGTSLRLKTNATLNTAKTVQLPF